MTRFATRWLAVAGISMISVSAAMAGTVTVWAWDPNFNGATMQEAGARYAASNPDFKLEVVDFAKADVEQKLQAQLASGTTDGLPDIVLMDVRLEGPRDGVAAAIDIEQLIKAPVIFITGSREPATLVRIAQDHPSGLLFKPFRFDQLKKAITEVIR